MSTGKPQMHRLTSVSQSGKSHRDMHTVNERRPHTSGGKHHEGRPLEGKSLSALIPQWGTSCTCADPAVLADPPKRIDYLFGTCKPIEAELVLREPVHGLMLSDHLGLISTFDLSADSASPARCVFPEAIFQGHRVLVPQDWETIYTQWRTLRSELAARTCGLHLSDLQSEVLLVCRLPGVDVLSKRARENASLFSAALEQLNSGAYHSQVQIGIHSRAR